MLFRQFVHPMAAVLTCVWILLSNSVPCVAAPSCDGAIFLRTEGPYKYGQEVSVRVIISPETHYPNGQVDVFSAHDKRYCVVAEDLDDGVWDAKIRIPLLNNWNRKIGFRLWQGGKLVCEKSKTIDIKAGLGMDIQGPEWSCAGYPAEYELTVGGDASLLSVHWDFGQEERSRYVNAQGRDVQRIRWKTPGEKSVIATIKAWGHTAQTMLINTRVAPEKAGLVVEGPQTVQQERLNEWTIVVPPMGPRHMTYHMALEVDWGQGETSRYVNKIYQFGIQKRFVRPGTYTVGLRLLERNVSPLLENKFIVKVIENKPRLDLQVTGPEQVTVGTPAFWTARTTRGRPPYEFSVEPWYDKKRTLSSESNVAKFNLKLSTPGKNKLIFQVVDADRVWSDWHYVNVLVTPEKDEATEVNNTQGDNTSTTGGTIKKDPLPDGGQQNGSGSGATPVGDPTGSPEIYGGLVIKGPARLSVKASANLKAVDHGGRVYPSATWVSSNTEVLWVSSNGRVQGLKTGNATVIVHVDDMRAYHDIEVVKGPFNPFQDAVDDLKKDPNVKVVVKKPPPDGEEADEQGAESGSDGGDSQSDTTDDDSDGLDSITIGGISVSSDDEKGSEDDLGFNKVGHEHAYGDTPDMPVKPDAGDSQSDGPEGSADDLDSMSIGGIPADPDDEEGPEDMLGFKKVGHKHESDNKGGLDLFGVSTDPNATALTDPYDLTGTWYLVNNYYGICGTHISPEAAQKSVVVRIEPKRDRYVGKVVRNGVLPGHESSRTTKYSWGPRLDQGEEVLWVERSEKDIYEGQITVDDSFGYQRIKGRKTPVIIRTMKDGGALICVNPGFFPHGCTKGKLREIHRYDQLCRNFLGFNNGRGFRTSPQKNIGQHKHDRESDSINLFGTEVGD